MTRKQAFLKIAKAFGTPYWQRTGRQEKLSDSGICCAYELITGNDLPDSFSRLSGGSEYTFWFPVRYWEQVDVVDDSVTISEADEHRSMFCCLMAAMSRKDFELFLKKEAN